MNAAATGPAMPRRPRWSRLGHPAALFVLISLLTGTLAIAFTPPLRGPDESAHFLRAYGYALGEILPRRTDEHGRRGLLLPAAIERDYAFFEAARERAQRDYRAIHEEFRRLQAQGPAAPPGALAFATFNGSESYAPAAYIPYVLAAGVARLAALDFLPTLYLMRATGLLAFTFVTAYAIARTPVLPWCFFAVALLPASSFARAVISADPAVLAGTLGVLALTLRAALKMPSRTASRSLWMGWCMLSKPSQIAFAPLELMARPLDRTLRALPAILAVTLPGLLLAAVWIAAVGGETAAWRFYGADAPPEQFSVRWKVGFLLTHPLHLATIMWGTNFYLVELGRQLIGVLGWLDMPLRPAAYPLIGALLTVASLGAIDAEPETRRRIAAISGLTALGYFNFVAFLMFVSTTPVSATAVQGIQGRYFTVLVPFAALVLAAACRRVPPWIAATGAVACALLSSVATLDAVLRSEWR